MLCKCSGKYIDIYFILKITYCSVRRNGSHWPNRDSLASRVRGCLSCHPGFYDLSFDNHTFARDFAIRYVFLLIFAWMSTDFRNLHDAPGALLQHYASMCVVGGRILGRRFRSEELLLVHFPFFRMPPPH